MDVYHKALHKLFEATEGKSSKAVDFKDLVKKLGFHGNYLAIYNFLSGEGWITESPKADFVFLTHWGLAEVKKSSSPSEDKSNEDLKNQANRALNTSREISNLLESFAQNVEMSSLPSIEKKIAELQNVLNQIKNN